ncbi:MAG: hypothetical protein WC997_04475 [Porticoccaceae bacterium]
MLKELGRFRALSDDGEEHTVILYQRYRIKIRINKQRILPTTREYMTLAGLELNPVKDDPAASRIIQTNQVIRRI